MEAGSAVPEGSIEAAAKGDRATVEPSSASPGGSPPRAQPTDRRASRPPSPQIHDAGAARCGIVTSAASSMFPVQHLPPQPRGNDRRPGQTVAWCVPAERESKMQPVVLALVALA